MTPPKPGFPGKWKADLPPAAGEEGGQYAGDSHAVRQWACSVRKELRGPLQQAPRVIPSAVEGRVSAAARAVLDNVT